MALRTNRQNAASYAAAMFGGGAEAWNVQRFGLRRNIYADYAAAISDKSGIPNGYNMGAPILPLKPGGMSSNSQGLMTLTAVNADAKMGLNMDASGTMTLTVVNADLDQIVALVASGALVLAGSANLSAGVQASATGSMSLSVNVATLGGIIPVEASGVITLSPTAVMTAQAFMEASSGGPTPLSPEGLAAALLDNNDIETNYSLRESLRLMLAAMAGKVSGAGTATITFRDVNDSKDRIIASVDVNGNRTAVTKDVT